MRTNKMTKKKGVISTSSQLLSLSLFHRFGPPIETVADLAASNVPWAATHPAWIFSMRESRDPLTLRVISQFRVMKNEELKKRSFKGDIAFSIERLPAGACTFTCCEISGLRGGEDDAFLLLGFDALLTCL